jgi:hemolysin activation/secretion protein
MTSRVPVASRPPATARPRAGRGILWGLALLAALLAPAEQARGQAIQRPADERPELPKFEAPAEREPLLAPVPPPAEPREELSAGPGVFVRGYRFEGSSVFSQEELERTVAPWAGRAIRSEDLVDVTDALTKLYVDHGYVNSGAVVPDQEFEDGVVKVRIVEGRLGEIRFSGNEQLRDGYLRARIEPGATAPLNVHKLERQLEILQRDPLIERVAARLAPGDRPGEAVLSVHVEEASRYHADLRFSNYEPPSIGALAGQFEGSVANLTGWGDALRGRFTITEGLKRYDGLYEVPVTPWGTLLSLEARYAGAEIVENPFEDMIGAIDSQFQSYQIGVLQPLYTSPRTRVQVGVFGNWRRTAVEVGDEYFPFPGSGARNGKTTASVLRFVFEWLQRDQKQVIAARSQISWGIDALGATVISDEDINEVFNHVIKAGHDPNARFVAWLLQLQWARRFGPWGIEAVFRTDLQLANHPLFTMEQIALGGFSTVRGYRENQVVRDEGVVSSLEVRVPVWRDPERLGTIQLAPFVDFGHAWDHPARADSYASTLASVGIGLRWSLSRYLDARIYWGQNLTSVTTSGDLQDKGVQFLISGHLP